MGWKPTRETNKARRAFEDYYAMGVGRSLRKLLEQYRTQKDSGSPPTLRLKTLKLWSSGHNWQERVKERDLELEAERMEHIRAEATKSGYALHFYRIHELGEIAAMLRMMMQDPENVFLPDVKTIGSGEEAERVDIRRFNAPLFAQWRGLLGDIAQEMGERTPGLKISGDLGVSFTPAQLAAARERVLEYERQMREQAPERENPMDDGEESNNES